MVVYLQCELTARDLDSRLLIASYLLLAGEPVGVGQVWGILSNVGHCPPGVNVFATANKFQAKGMARCREFWHPVVAMNEEVLAVRDEHEFLRTYDPKAMSLATLVLHETAQHKDLVTREFPNVRGKVIGSARIDLLREHRNIYEKDAKSYAEKGRYVLFNTNFSHANSTWGDVDKALSVSLSAVDEKDTLTRTRIRQTVSDDMTNFTTVSEIVRHLAGKHRIIVRPHPAENAQRWKEFPGVEVVMGSNAIPWMLGADLVIHTNSTTGFEAAVMGVPCLNVGAPDDRYFMDHINCSIQSAPQAVEAIATFLGNRSGPIADHKTVLGDYPCEGAKNIAKAILEVGRSLPPAPPITGWGAIKRSDEQRRKFLVSTETLIERVNAICVPINRQRLDVTPLDDSLFLIRPL